MLTSLLLSLAMATSAREPTIVIDERPTISIMLADYDLSRADGVKSLKRKIRWAANRVCIRGYGLAMYWESVACVRSAVADADAQLDAILAHHRAGTPLVATIAVTGNSK